MKKYALPIIFLLALNVVLFSEASGDSNECQADTICIHPGDFLKYEITDGFEILYEFGDEIDDEKIQYFEKGTHSDGTPYQEQFILDKKTGDTFEINNPDEKYSSLHVLIPIPIIPEDPNSCNDESIVFKGKSIDIISCEVDESDSYSKLSFGIDSGILIESTIRVNLDYLEETKQIETYSKLIDTNIILDEDKVTKQIQIDSPSLEGSGTILDDESDTDYDVLPGEPETIVPLLPDQELRQGVDDTKPKPKIPDWVKNTMQWFSEGLISEQEMINGIQFLVSEGIINIEEPVEEPKVEVVEAKLSDDNKNVKIKADLFGFDVKDISKLVVSVYLLDFETGKTVFTKIIADTKKVIQQNDGEEKIKIDELVLVEKNKEENTSQIELDVELINGGDTGRLGVNVGIDDGENEDFGSLVIEPTRSDDD